MAVRLTRPSKQLIYELKSSKEARREDSSLEAAEVWGRGRLTFDQRSAVEDAQFTVRLTINPKTGDVEERRQVSLVAMRQELVWQWLTDPACKSNLADEEGNALPHRRTVLNEYVDPDDLSDLGDYLLGKHFPEMFAELDEDGANPTTVSEPSDEPNLLRLPEETNTSKSRKTGSSSK